MQVKDSPKAKWYTLFALLLIFFLFIVGFDYVGFQKKTKDEISLANIPVFVVPQGPLTISVTENGTVRPREQIILKNNMEDPSTILFIVEEGTPVKKGDLLVELDATQQEKELHIKQLEVQNEQADLISARENFAVVTNQAEADIEQADLNFDFAKQDLKKYGEGEYPKLLKEAEAKITLAEEELTQAKNELKWSEVLYKEKYLAETEFLQDELTQKKAQLNLELSREERTLLKDYTYKRMIAELESAVYQTEMALERAKRKASADIAQASATLNAREAQYEDEVEEMYELQREIANARMTAPIDGVALYASSVAEDWDNDEDRIREGATVDERGEILYLPTTDSYNVDVKIQEVNLNKIRLDLPVRIKVDALPHRSYTGKVVSISPLPDSQERFLNPNLKVYNTDIHIEGSGDELRNGMSCRVEILVAHYPNALYIPIQAVVKIRHQPMVFVARENRIEARAVEIGLDNNRMIHILSGLEKGEIVLLKPPLDHAEIDEEEEAPFPEQEPSVDFRKPAENETNKENEGEKSMGRDLAEVESVSS